jgi:methionyl-tRNA synthetase
MDKSKYYITTAIPYVNAAPHLGHALEFIQTDVIARYEKSLGKDVALVTGADENSLKNVQAAEKLGMSTAELCQKNATIFKDMAEKIGLSFTKFRRTSNKEKHWPGVHKLWSLCNESGDIYKKKYKGLYCVGCEAFYEESDLVEGLCPEHETKPEVIEEVNYFFKLSKYQDQLEKLIETDELMILPETRKNEVLSFIRSGLKDFSISRSVKRAKGWGVPVPDDKSQILYVWFDALGTYLTGIGYGIDEQEFEGFWPAFTHVIGKGILRFHAIYWPAILLSSGLKLPKTIFVHGYITVEGQKMSKTLGNIIDPFYVMDKYGVDPLRYCLLSEVPTFGDGDFSEKILIEKNNNELIANVGNLVNRTMVFVNNNFEGVVPKTKLEESDEIFFEKQATLIGSVTEQLERMDIREALSDIMHFAKNSNKYFQDNKPWVLIKEDSVRAGTVLNVLVQQIKDIAILVEPYMPGTSEKIFRQLSVAPRKWVDLGVPSVDEGHHLGKPEILFRKIDEEKIKKIEKRLERRQEKLKSKFSELELEVGQIISCERHPDAEKLFIEMVKLSDGERQIVSGLADYYFPENLVGRKVIVVKNLKSAKLRGVESQGMLLAADGRELSPGKGEKGASMEQDVVEVLFADESKVGDKVKLAGERSRPKKEIDIKYFSKIKIEVDDYYVLSEGKKLSTKTQELKTKNIKKGEVS